MPSNQLSANPRAAQWSRRRLLKTLFCSSAALTLNLSSRALRAAELSAPDDLHWLAIGDFGSNDPSQLEVAAGLKKYVQTAGLKPEGLLLLGDNFYKKMNDGVKSERWRTGFEDIYPADVFPGPCPAVLGNHDYGDNVGGEQTQLEYAKTKTRWTMPAKWYRMDLPTAKPLITFLFLDTNLPSVKNGDDAKGKPKRSLTVEEEAAQWAWLDAELAKPRAQYTIVVGHHPVYSNGQHGDTKSLVTQLAPVLQKNSAHIYLCGHDHDMQHLELEGQKTSFVLSGGGGAHTRELPKTEARGIFGKPLHGFTHIQVNPQRLLFRHVQPDGTQVHAFEKLPDFSFKLI
jgi:3',5'-cyclic AMP phosphodiesterase CpdA